MKEQIKPTFSKVSDSQIKVDRIIPETVETITLDINDVVNQMANIQATIDNLEKGRVQDNKRYDDAEQPHKDKLVELQGYLDQADSLGIKPTPVEDVKPDMEESSLLQSEEVLK